MWHAERLLRRLDHPTFGIIHDGHDILALQNDVLGSGTDESEDGDEVKLKLRNLQICYIRFGELSCDFHVVDTRADQAVELAHILTGSSAQMPVPSEGQACAPRPPFDSMCDDLLSDVTRQLQALTATDPLFARDTAEQVSARAQRAVDAMAATAGPLRDNRTDATAPSMSTNNITFVVAHGGIIRAMVSYCTNTISQKQLFPRGHVLLFMRHAESVNNRAFQKSPDALIPFIPRIDLKALHTSLSATSGYDSVLVDKFVDLSRKMEPIRRGLMSVGLANVNFYVSPMIRTVETFLSLVCGIVCATNEHVHVTLNADLQEVRKQISDLRTRTDTAVRMVQSFMGK